MMGQFKGLIARGGADSSFAGILTIGYVPDKHTTIAHEGEKSPRDEEANSLLSEPTLSPKQGFECKTASLQ